MPAHGPGSPLVPPFVPAAVHAFRDLDALDEAYTSSPPGFFYARDGHPNAAELSDKLNALHNATWGAVTASGMAAISAAVLPRVRSGDRIVASDKLYGKTNVLFRELERFGVWTEFVDVCDLGAVSASLNRERAAVLFVETLSNPNCRVCDLPAVADAAHKVGATVIVDNAFASPVLFRPLDHGADVVMESLTKIIGGHSDITLGYLGGKDATFGAAAISGVSTFGFNASPFDCWLALRSLETLDLRVDFAADNAAEVADWLATRPEVSRVVYPGRPDHPDAPTAAKLLPRGCGHMLCFELPGGRVAVNRFLRAAPGIPLAPSFGHTGTTISHPVTASHRYESEEAKARQGITPGLIRLSVGCEPLERITAELEKGLRASG